MSRTIKKGKEHRVVLVAGTEAETKRQIQEWNLQRRKKEPKTRIGNELDYLVPWALANGYNPKK